MSVQEVLETRRVRIPVMKNPSRPKMRAPRRTLAQKNWVALSACLTVAALALVAGL